MKIQWINFLGRVNIDYKVDETNDFNSVLSPDMFELNIIDLRDNRIWENSLNYKDYNNIEMMNHFNSIFNMIIESKNTKFLFILPKNVNFSTHYNYRTSKHLVSTPVKDMLSSFSTLLRNIIPLGIYNIKYEKTITTINENKLRSDFYFNEEIASIEEIQILRSDKSGKITAYRDGVYTVTGLDIQENVELQSFCEDFNLLSEPGIIAPEWFKNINILDDAEQTLKINKAEEIIKNSKDNIEKATNKLIENNEYKSILYTTGDKLVDVVVKILEQILEVNLEGFLDEKKEDFLFSLDDMYFIGEVKGVNSNVKSSNLGQLDHHYLEYIENNNVDEGNVFKLLIMNHQKKKAPDKREPVHQNQINDADRKYSLLIIETTELLKLYEKKINGEINKEKCIALLKGTGILNLNQLEV